MLSPLAQRRWQRFRTHKRGFIAALLFLVLFVISLGADFIANDRPIVVRYDGEWLFPIFQSIPETYYGGSFETEAIYTDPFVIELIEEKGFLVMPPIPYGYRAPAYDLTAPAPTPPDRTHWLGTDDEARDVAARLIHGVRISLLFGLTLAAIGSVIGILVGLMQGFYGGLTDLIGQRLIEIWGGLPSLYLLIILAAIVQPDFWWLLGLMILFSWPALVGLVRAETLRTRKLDYVRAAHALGAGNWRIMVRHILPNAFTASLTFMPFVASGAITTLTALDFIGFGLPPGSASLGELLKQGKENLQAPWLGLTGFFTIAVILMLLVFIGEGVRDAFDPRQRNKP